MKPGEQDDTSPFWPFVAALLAVLCSLVVSWGTMTEARAERRSALAAMELRMAALVVYTAGSTYAEASGDYQARVADALSLLVAAGEPPVPGVTHPFRAVEDDDRATVSELLAHVIAHGEALVDGRSLPDEEVDHDHAEWDAALNEAVMRARMGARSAEKIANWTLVACGLIAASASASFVRSRQRAIAQRAYTDAALGAARRLEALLNDSSDIILVYDVEGRIAYQSSSAGAHFSPEDLESVSALCALAGDGALDLERQMSVSASSSLHRLRRSDSTARWFDVRVTDLSAEPEVMGRLVTIRDAHREVELRNELERQAMLDSLTGLPNRRVLDPALVAARSALSPGRQIALLMLDLDGFKETNDSLGHAIGDELLRQLAKRLSHVVRSTETLVRLGGDEFALVLPSVTGEVEVLQAATRIHGVLREPFEIHGHLELAKTSIGIVLSDGETDGSELLRQADIALYRSKHLGGGRTIVFDSVLELEFAQGAAINRAMREADFDSEFSLVFQPIVAMATGGLFSLEALLRWESPTLGSVSPAEFIPLAERNGQIIAIGDWVCDRACAQLAAWADEPALEGAGISINVSTRQLADPKFVDRFMDRVTAHGVDPSRLVVEVTESVMIRENTAVTERLERLRRAGVRVAIDDFGSGYSSLGQLIGLPFDLIKVDRSLLLTLQGLRDDGQDSCAIMSAIVSIAEALRVPLVAEGVETEEQAASLAASGVLLTQGYLFGRPVSPEEAVECLRQTQTRSGWGS